MIYEALRKELRAKRHRMTAQREIVLRVFVNSGGKHLGAEDVYRHLVAKKYKISKATVYRSVELLSKLGFLRKLEFGEGIYRYELATQSDNKTLHQHIVCKGCGEILEIDEKIVKDLVHNVMKRTKYKITDYDIKFYGLCRKCQNKINRNAQQNT